MPRGVRATGYGAAGGRRDTAARSAKQKTKRNRREADPRVSAAMEEARKAQEALDARMAEEAANPVLGPAEGALLAKRLEVARANEAAVTAQVEAEQEAIEQAPEPKPEPKPQPVVHTPDPEVIKRAFADPSDYIMIRRFKPFDVDSVPAGQEGDPRNWTLGAARQMLIKGHSLAHVVGTTGWGKKWFDDIPVDEDGYGKGTEAWLEALDKKEQKGLGQ